VPRKQSVDIIQYKIVKCNHPLLAGKAPNATFRYHCPPSGNAPVHFICSTYDIIYPLLSYVPTLWCVEKFFIFRCASKASLDKLSV